MSIENIIKEHIEQYIEKISLRYDIPKEELIKLFYHYRNKGTGAGGSNTNRNGLSYEEKTDLSTRYKVLRKNSNCIHCIEIQFDNEKVYTRINKGHIFKCIERVGNSIQSGHGCKNPDECYVDKYLKIIFIIEKKFQQVSGSVCEKIQTPHFKVYQYKKTFPSYKIGIYLLFIRLV
jgi:hypothetical protein